MTEHRQLPALDPAITEELRRLAATYADAVDGRERELLLSAFHPDATLVVERAESESRPMRGHEQIGRITTAIAKYRQTFHFIGHSTYRPAPDGASGTVACIAHHRWTDDAGTDLDHVMYIRYLDEYRTGDDGIWRIAARIVHVEWSETRVIAATELGQTERR